ncbi:cytochrome c oxidase subunit 7A-related protein, mitochondrial-like [Phthorimaea operculella]|nr:cytochrome c oxidase subunit 7A-related protein, mitochondrial-like [Phthorimaea operculella]
MYHQLSRMTGRLVSATHLQSPLFPVAPIALQRVDPPAIKYNTAHLSSVAEACPAPGGARRMIPGTNIPYPPVPETIRKRQQQFQKEDDVPVFLKGGPMDAILYRLTMALCLLGLAGVVHTIYGHAIPKKG